MKRAIQFNSTEWHSEWHWHSKLVLHLFLNPLLPREMERGEREKERERERESERERKRGRD